jgi:hypothetical protein
VWIGLAYRVEWREKKERSLRKRSFRKLIVIALSAAALLIAATVAFGAVTTTLEVVPRPNKASTKKKVRPITLEINVTMSDPAVAQPPPLKQVVIRFNKGGQFNGKLFPKCKFSALQNQGPKACPKGSKVGTGSAVASAKPIIDTVNAKTTIYNGEAKNGVPTVLLYNVPDISSPITVQGTVAKKSAVSCANGAGKCDYVLTFNVPQIPTLPNAPAASVLSVKTKTLKVFVKKKKRVHGKKRTVKIPYIGAPTKCSGKWVADATFSFYDGQTSSTTASLPCKK